MGKVYLVGAGPGDPGLLTVKAKRCIEAADVIIYDYLANKVILDYARSDAEIIYVGKKGGDHTCPQIDINSLLVEKGKSGTIIVRLKGGDPYIFGRGGEEAEELVEANIPFEVVPGVTSAQAASAYAGIPLTHRSFTSSVAYITGHEDPDKDQSSIDWEKISTSIGTLVFFMGIGNLPKITKKLMENGRSPKTPVALISWGTHPKQRTVIGNLENIVSLSIENKIKPPSIIVVGEVVSLRDKLNWFENRSLFGKKIIVTRAREQMSDFASVLSENGAEVIEFPTIQINPPKDFAELDQGIDNLSDYDWLIFTSVNGVKYFKKRLFEKGLDARALNGIRICCIGPATAQKVRELGIVADLLPDEYRAEGVLEKMEKINGSDLKGVKVLIPRAKVAREVLPEKLKEMGAQVDIVAAYETVKPAGMTENIESMLTNGEIWSVTFTSSSTVRNFCEMFPGKNVQELLKNTQVACIGPITAQTAQELGLKIDIMPEEYTISSLVNKLVAQSQVDVKQCKCSCK